MKNRIEETFNRLKKEGKKALIPYIMAGDPDLDHTESFLLELEEAGADIVELGIPFTDPVADGPTIQRAAERALSSGTTLRRVMDFIPRLREKIHIPIVLMTYYNPVFKYGVPKFAKKAAEVGVDGVIIPDLIPEEAGELLRASEEVGLSTVFLLAPTSGIDRIKLVASVSKGFIYYVSITGVTGAQLKLDTKISNSINSIRSVTDTPIVIGFGISNPQEASIVAQLCDGVVVGSAIVRRIGAGEPIGDFVRFLREVV